MVRRIVSVIGIGTISSSDPIYILAEELGKGLVNRGYRVMTGGLGGVMEAVSKGARSSENYREGDVIGVLPGNDKGDANRFVDIPIPTGLGIARNTIITNSDAVIAVGGGSGTLSEMAFSWQRGKLLIAMDVEGWSGRLGDTKVDNRTRKDNVPDDRVFRAATVKDALDILEARISDYI